MKNRILPISLAIMFILAVGLVSCTAEVSEMAKHTLTIYSTDGGYSNTCVPSIDCTCGEGTEDSGGLTVPEECLCAEGTEVGIESTPDPGYRFTGWTGDVETIADVKATKTTITMNDDYSITANFVKQYDLTISSTAGGSVAMPGEGIHTYDEGEVVNLVAQADEGYHFVNWTGDVSTIADVNATVTTITVSNIYSTTANFGVDLYFQADAHVWLSGPGALAPEARSPRVLLQVLTNMVVDSVRVDLPGGGSVVLPRYTDAFSPGVDWTTLFRFLTWEPGVSTAGAEYTFIGLDEGGEPVPGARDTDVWVGVEPPDPPANVRCELTDYGILVSWDEGPMIPGSFEPAAGPQLGFYHFQVGSVGAWEVVYGAAGISASPHLIPRNKVDFVEGKDFGLSLSELQDGAYRLVPRVISFAPQGSLGKGNEYNNHDPSQIITFTIQDGEIIIK